MSNIDFSEIRKLSIEERLQLIDEIWESIAESEGEDPVTDEQRQMFDERLEAHRRAPETSTPWEEVKARLLAME